MHNISKLLMNRLYPKILGILFVDFFGQLLLQQKNKFDVEKSKHYQWLKKYTVKSLAKNKFPDLVGASKKNQHVKDLEKRPLWPIHKIVKDMIGHHFYRWVNKGNDIGVILPSGKYKKIGVIPKDYKRKKTNAIVLTVSIFHDQEEAKEYCEDKFLFSSNQKKYIQYCLDKTSEAFPVEFVWVDESKGEKGVLRLLNGTPLERDKNTGGWAMTDNALGGEPVVVFMNFNTTTHFSVFNSVLLHELAHFMGIHHHHGSNKVTKKDVLSDCPYRHPSTRESNVSYLSCAHILGPENSSMRHIIFEFAATLYGHSNPYPNAKEVEFVFKAYNKNKPVTQTTKFIKDKKKYIVTINGPYVGTVHSPHAPATYNFSHIVQPLGGIFWGVECHTEPGSFSTYNALHSSWEWFYRNSNLSLTYSTKTGVTKVIGSTMNDRVYGHDADQVFDLYGGGDHVYGGHGGHKKFVINKDRLSYDNVIFPQRAKWLIQFNQLNKDDLQFLKVPSTMDLQVIYKREKTSRKYYNQDVFKTAPNLYHELRIKNYFKKKVSKQITFEVGGKKIPKLEKFSNKALPEISKKILKEVYIPFNSRVTLQEIVTLVKNKLFLQYGVEIKTPDMIYFSNDNIEGISFYYYQADEGEDLSDLDIRIDGDMMSKDDDHINTAYKGSYSTAYIQSIYDDKTIKSGSELRIKMQFDYSVAATPRKKPFTFDLVSFVPSLSGLKNQKSCQHHLIGK